MEKKIFYKFQKMELGQFATFEEKYNSQESVNIQTQFQFSYNKEERIILCNCIITFLQSKEIILKSELYCFFELEKESLEAVKEENTLVFPQELLAQFASLAYGSMRGAIHVKSINTPFVNIILPPVIIADMLDKPYVVNI